VDLVWDFLRPRGQRRLDLFATGALLAFVVAFAVFALQAAIELRGKHLLTSDLRLPQWGFYLVGALGVVGAAWATIVRLRQVMRTPGPAPVTGSEIA
jgi:TRAP-type C4-dicarboxylate transport system permease small subunit